MVPNVFLGLQEIGCMYLCVQSQDLKSTNNVRFSDGADVLIGGTMGDGNRKVALGTWTKHGIYYFFHLICDHESWHHVV
jgi:hypothetical protein